MNNSSIFRMACPCAIAMVVLLTSGCDQPAAPQIDGDELARVQKDKSKVENELKLLREDVEKKYNDLIKQNEELQKANDELKQQVEKAQDETDKAKKDLQEHMTKYKIGVRQKAKGLQIPHLETADQKSFEGVVVTEVTPETLVFQHSGGVARIPLEKLSSNLQQQFAYDPEEIKAMEAAKLAAEAAEKDDTGVATVPKEVLSRVDPFVLKRLRDRISSRKAEIARIKKESKAAQEGPYGQTSLTKLRVKVLAQRTLRLEDEIKELQNMLYKAAGS
jgi:chaperonin cofactor prefoldin